MMKNNVLIRSVYLRWQTILLVFLFLPLLGGCICINALRFVMTENRTFYFSENFEEIAGGKFIKYEKPLAREVRFSFIVDQENIIGPDRGYGVINDSKTKQEIETGTIVIPNVTFNATDFLENKATYYEMKLATITDPELRQRYSDFAAQAKSAEIANLRAHQAYGEAMAAAELTQSVVGVVVSLVSAMKVYVRVTMQEATDWLVKESNCVGEEAPEGTILWFTYLLKIDVSDVPSGTKWDNKYFVSASLINSDKEEIQSFCVVDYKAYAPKLPETHSVPKGYIDYFPEVTHFGDVPTNVYAHAIWMVIARSALDDLYEAKKWKDEKSKLLLE